MKYLELLANQFNGRVAVREKRPNIFQLVVPLYHEDGDMVDIFLEEGTNGTIKVSDYAMTLQRLSYSYDIDTPNKEKIFQTILSENQVNETGGNLWIETQPESLYPAIMQFSQTVAKISSMRLYKREIIHSLFFELLEEFVESKLCHFKPQKDYFPIHNHEEYPVDYCFNGRPVPSFLFGINSIAKAHLATICCLKFHNESIRFRSLIVLENLDVLGKKDLARLMSAGDKPFPSLDDFINNGEEYLARDLK